MGQDHVSLPKKVEVRKYYYFQFLKLVYKLQCTKIFQYTCSTNSLWKSRKSWKRANLSGRHKLHWQPVSQKPGRSFVLSVNQAATAHHKQTITSPFICTLCLTFDHCHLHLDKPIRECQEQTRLGHDLLWCQLAPPVLQSGNPPSPTITSTHLLTHHPQLYVKMITI